MADMTIQLDGGQLTEKEMATLLETGVECDDGPEQTIVATVPVSPLTALPPDIELINPVTGAIVNTDDIDSLILGCDECKKLMAELKTFDHTLREIAWSKTVGSTKTRRLKGRQYQAKLEEGPRYPVSAILKETWNSYPQFRDKYLKIGAINLQMREVGKLKSMTSDDPAFAQFKGMIEDAIAKGTDGLPSVSLEGGGET